MRFVWLCVVSSAAFGQNVCADLDAGRLKAGTFVYRTVVNGKDAGASRIEVRRAFDGNFAYSNRVTGAFSQSWEAVATRAFIPVSAKLVRGEGLEAKTDFELTYREGRVNGFAVDMKAPSPVRRTIDEAVVANTVDQRIDWAAVMSFASYEPGAECTFRVFDPGTGNSMVHVTVGQSAAVSVPAGTFEGTVVTYRIDKNRGAETYRLTMDRWGRYLVREEFPNGAVTELVKIEP